MDELNTSSCMGLFKEMIVDKSFEGEVHKYVDYVELNVTTISSSLYHQTYFWLLLVILTEVIAWLCMKQRHGQRDHIMSKSCTPL